MVPIHSHWSVVVWRCATASWAQDMGVNHRGRTLERWLSLGCLRLSAGYPLYPLNRWKVNGDFSVINHFIGSSLWAELFVILRHWGCCCCCGVFFCDGLPRYNFWSLLLWLSLRSCWICFTNERKLTDEGFIYSNEQVWIMIRPFPVNHMLKTSNSIRDSFPLRHLLFVVSRSWGHNN